MKKIFLFLFLAKFAHASPLAQNLSGAVSSATGGAGVSVIDIVDGALLNPATIAFFPTKQVSISYSKSRADLVIVDNGQDALFPAAIAYDQLANDIYKNKIYHLIIAYPLAPKISLGVDFHYNDFRFTNSETTYQQTLANVGLIWIPYQNLTVGITHKDMALSDTDLPDSLDHVTVTTIGAAYVYETFAQLRFDVETVEKQPSGRYIYKIGLETYINDWIITRFGYRNDNVASLNYTTLGAGFAGPQFGLHYAYQSEANNTVDPLHIIDLSFPF